MIHLSQQGRVILLMLALIFGVVAPAALSRAEAPSTTLRMSEALQLDPVLNQNAYSVLVPDGWKFQGEIIWFNGTPNPWPHFSVSDPVQHAAWRRFPRMFYVDGVADSQRWPEGSVLPSGFEVRKLPASPREYVEKLIVPKMIAEVASAKDVKLVSETDMPEVAKALTDHDPLHRTASTSRFRIAYTAAGGAVERDFIATLIVGQPKAPGNSILWMADVTTMRAPAGRLDALMPTFATINSSVKMLLPWYNTLVQVQEQCLRHQQEQEALMLKNQRDAINARMDILRDYGRQSSQMVSDEIQKRFTEQMAAKSEEQTRFMHYVNDTGGYTDPNDGSTVDLSAEYQYHYVSNHGDIVETNDPTYSPPIDPSTSWQQMSRVN
jgi:hypothetical protein